MDNKEILLKELEEIRKDFELTRASVFNERNISQKEYEAEIRNIDRMDKIVRNRMEAIKNRK